MIVLMVILMRLAGADLCQDLNSDMSRVQRDNESLERQLRSHGSEWQPSTSTASANAQSTGLRSLEHDTDFVCLSRYLCVCHTISAAVLFLSVRLIK